MNPDDFSFVDQAILLETLEMVAYISEFESEFEVESFLPSDEEWEIFKSSAISVIPDEEIDLEF